MDQARADARTYALCVFMPIHADAGSDPVMTKTQKAAALGGTCRLTDMMARIEVDLNEVLRPVNASAVVTAAIQCRECASAEQCDAWLAAHDEGDGHEVPDFCINAEFLQAFPTAVD